MTSTTNKAGNKVILHLGYYRYVLDPKVATELFLALTKETVERFDDKWNSEMRKQEPRVLPTDSTEIKITLLPEADYAMGKLLYAAEQSNKGEGE